LKKKINSRVIALTTFLGEVAAAVPLQKKHFATTAQ